MISHQTTFVERLHAQYFGVLTLFCLSRANADIAQVRVKAKQEQAAYQASLRKEQMKVDSLERTLEQRVSSNYSFHHPDGNDECQIYQFV